MFKTTKITFYYLGSDFLFSIFGNHYSYMVEQFLDYIRTEKRYSPHTITSYAKDLADFSLFVKETEGQNEILYVDKKVIKNYMINLSERHLSKRSINRKLSTLRSFYQYLLRLGEIQVSPMESITSLKFYPEKQLPFSQEEMAEVLEVLKASGTTLDYLVVETLYQTGMRRAELCQLKLNDVRFSSNEIRVVGKGNKVRIIPISEALKDLLCAYYQNDRSPNDVASTYFFIHDNGKKLTEKFVYSVVNNYFSLVSSKKKRSPHMLRHSFATHLLDNGAEISKVKEIMGHASLASTQVYTSANIQQLKKVLEANHPRAKRDNK